MTLTETPLMERVGVEMGAAEDNFAKAFARLIVPEIVAELRRVAANDEPREPTLVNRAECARLLNISVPTLDRALRAGCPKVHVGRHVRFDVAEVRAWLNKNGKRPLRKSTELTGSLLTAAGVARKK